ncbi:MAG TPA: 3'(2'),5'-bisphosphate nucleotidase CysQ [Steroidobacteraceae bacterium]|nr:3'(2'),5'-bisphosphate nucleotidase CysQ [Steroidobacteraceae bacterium]
MSDGALLEAMISAALAAGRAAFEVYQGRFEVQRKPDNSPVTAADHAAERVILEHLSAHAPGLAVIAEEQVAVGRVPRLGSEFVLVDPLDGTREFVQRNGEFTVNIALVRGVAPILGVIYAPAVGALFAGDVMAKTAWQSHQPTDAPLSSERGAIRIRRAPEKGITVVASRSHRTPETDAYLERYEIAQVLSIGSSLKFCKVAAGEADFYPRLGTTMEWDTAAGQAILVAAGGQVVTADGVPLQYGKPEFRNPWFFATGTVDVKQPG